jgi:L-ascorbate metabolism protein UlaG (beta-lactamase superfamily)
MAKRMKTSRRAAPRLLLIALLLLALGVALALHLRPSLVPYAHLMHESPAAHDAGELKVTFLGVSTLLFDDGETALMTDGFFSRPSVFSLLRPIKPDTERIAGSLRQAGIEQLAAVIVVHSHYDHALDAPVVAQRTGAVLVGSPSTANIGRGYGLDERRLVVPSPGETLAFGRFRVRLIESAHVPSVLPLPGKIREPLVPPAAVRDYRMGECYSVLIEHDGRSILVQGSAGFIPGALRGVEAEVVYLGVGLLGRQPPDYREDYWRETVEAVGARRVFAVHWDDFTRPSSAPLVPMLRIVDDVDSAMRFLVARGERAGVDIRLPVAWRAVDPFTDIAHATPPTSRLSLRSGSFASAR